jgi:hypothetical protein
LVISGLQAAGEKPGLASGAVTSAFLYVFNNLTAKVVDMDGRVKVGELVQGGKT